VNVTATERKRILILYRLRFVRFDVLIAAMLKVEFLECYILSLGK